MPIFSVLTDIWQVAEAIGETHLDDTPTATSNMLPPQNSPR